MKIVALTHCDTHLVEIFGVHKLLNSWSYFHPEIPIVWFDSNAINEIKKKYPGFALYSFNCCLIHEAKQAFNADLAIFIDADSIILSRLEEVLIGDFDIASVRDVPLGHTENEDMNRPICGVPNTRWINAGFVATTSQRFIKDWYLINKDAIENKPRGINFYKMVEQDTLNMVFHMGREYKTKILDAVETDLYYGPASQNYTLGRKPPKSIEHYGNYFCESWLDIKLENGIPMLDGKKIRVIHQSHGGLKPKLQDDLFSEEFLPYIKKITNAI